MIKQLILTTLISTGVATTTPVYHADEISPTSNSNTTESYTITPTLTYRGVTAWQNQRINNTGSYYEDGYISDDKYNITGNNNFLNVKGNLYKEQVYIPTDETPEDVDLYYYRNADYIDDANNDNIPTMQALYVLKITPYNYNTDTTVHLNINLNIEPIRLYYADNDIVIIENVYMQRTIYTTTSDNWDSFIDKTITKEQCKTIINDIRNPNNGFYYQATVNRADLGYEDINGDYSYVDEFDIQITPKTDNYIVISYIPYVQAHMKDNQTHLSYNYAWKNVITSGQLFNPTGFTITGTNVIINGGYEVIDLPGLMWEILTMPFAFVSQAFNLTLFPGTPYQLNIANLFLSIVAVFIFVWLIGQFLKLKG